MTCSWACPGPPQSSPDCCLCRCPSICSTSWARSGCRAALTLVLLFEALVIAILGLVPGQSPTTFAVELLSVGGAVWLFATGMFTVRRPAIDQLAPIVVNAVAAQLATLPVMAAGASLLARSGGGLYWLVPALVLLLGAGVMNAWVLLIEILR
jgi:hypothetical protein